MVLPLTDHLPYRWARKQTGLKSLWAKVGARLLKREEIYTHGGIIQTEGLVREILPIGLPLSKLAPVQLGQRLRVGAMRWLYDTLPFISTPLWFNSTGFIIKPES